MALPPIPPRDPNLLSVPAPSDAPAQQAVLAASPSFKHKFRSSKDDGIDSTFVQPSAWNDDHDLEMPQASVLGRDPTGAGPAQSLPLDYEAGDGLHMPTTAHVQALIAAAIAAMAPPGDTGDLCASMAQSKAGWLLLYGQTIGNIGSGAVFADVTAQNLFNLFWGINGGTWPVAPSRGASAAFDWANNKTIALPDARGCVIGMIDGGRGINTLIDVFGHVVGEQNHSLTAVENGPHLHPLNPSDGGIPISFNNGGGQTGGGAVMWSKGYSVGNTDWNGSGTPHNTVQPTMGAYIFIHL